MQIRCVGNQAKLSVPLWSTYGMICKSCFALELAQCSRLSGECPLLHPDHHTPHTH